MQHEFDEYLGSKWVCYLENSVYHFLGTISRFKHNHSCFIPSLLFLDILKGREGVNTPNPVSFFTLDFDQVSLGALICRRTIYLQNQNSIIYLQPKGIGTIQVKICLCKNSRNVRKREKKPDYDSMTTSLVRRPLRLDKTLTECVSVK